MKKINILIMLFIGMISYGQQIITIEQRGEYFFNDEDVPQDVTQINDINHLLDKFVGTWQCIYNGNTIKITVYKERETNPYTDITEDTLAFAYQILDSSGNYILGSSDTGLHKGNGISYNPSNKGFIFDLLDACGMDKSVYLVPEIPIYRNPNATAYTVMQFVVLNTMFGGIVSDEDMAPASCVSVSNYLPYRQIVLMDKQ